MNNEVIEIAHQMSCTSQAFERELHAFAPTPGSRLDPQAPGFDASAWVKAFIRLYESDQNSAPARVLGVAFRNLNAYGWSTGAESQMTVFTRVVSLFSSLTRHRRGRRIDILREFEGVIEAGELLLVLGPPGSGCSTFLKALAGETAGLTVDPNSYLNFRGTYGILLQPAV